MKRRIPLWLTLVPLVLAVALYGLLWRGWSEDFRTQLALWLPSENLTESLSIRGFPYRLEAEVKTPKLTTGDTIKVELQADRAVINRGPWQKDLTVLRFEAPQAQITISPTLAANLQAKTALSSINYGEGRLRRFSNILQSARVTLAGIPTPFTADTLELHLREQQGEPVPSTSPRLAAQAQLILSAARLRIGGGDALTMAAEILATAPARLTSYARWTPNGTLELTKLTLADAHGEVAQLEATLVPQNQTLILAGTLTTTCPGAFTSSITGQTTPEYRLRVPVRLAVSGPLSALTITPPTENLTTRPRRTKEPACPRILG